MLVEGYDPPLEIIATVKRILQAAHIEVGGVEYLINDRDGEVYFYDVNALSNFVADAPNVVGFDPFPQLVDFILARAGLPDAVALWSGQAVGLVRAGTTSQVVARLVDETVAALAGVQPA